MTDKSKESLSALMDGEASEIEVHQLLRGFNSDESLKGSWLTFQQVRAVVKGENCLSSEQHRELHTRISRAISSEYLPESLTNARPWIGAGYIKPAAGIAVAASLVFAAFFVTQFSDSPDPARGMADGESGVPEQVASGQMVQSQSVTAQTAGRQIAVDSNRWIDQYPDDAELTELDDEKQRRLRDYLNQHDRMVRMNPNARMVVLDNSVSN